MEIDILVNELFIYSCVLLVTYKVLLLNAASKKVYFFLCNLGRRLSFKLRPTSLLALFSSISLPPFKNSTCQSEVVNNIIHHIVNETIPQ